MVGEPKVAILDAIRQIAFATILSDGPVYVSTVALGNRVTQEGDSRYILTHLRQLKEVALKQRGHG